MSADKLEATLDALRTARAAIDDEAAVALSEAKAAVSAYREGVPGA